ncbi:MAG: ABC transporter ATP-binding protein [Hyphomicrobiales bacterium]
MSCASKGLHLQVQSLAWGPAPGQTLIRNIGFEVGPGERLAIIGANGAGKSSLLRCLYRVHRPSHGRVLIDGKDVWAMPPHEVAQRVAVVLQEMPGDFPYTVSDVVMMGRIPHRQGLSGWSERDRFHCRHALEHLDLRNLAARRFLTLSGGEKQRVLVARALAQEPQLIILDEPTNHLDIRHQLETLDLLKDLGLTLITTLHDINQAAGFATQIALMRNGEIAARGDPASVLTPPAIASAFGVTALLHHGAQAATPQFTFSLATRQS